MKFLCDEMLKGLSRWLRAAGHDAASGADGAPDRELLQMAISEDRLLLTRDRKMLEMRHAADTVLLLDSMDLDDCARELTDKLSLNWFYRPFTRCLLCNTPLQEAGTDLRRLAPPGVLNGDMPLRHCPQCEKLFWPGGHVQRMQRRLALWQGASVGQSDETGTIPGMQGFDARGTQAGGQSKLPLVGE